MKNLLKPRKNAKPRHLGIIYVDPSSFLTLFTTGMKWRQSFEILEGAPKDAELVAVTYENTTHGVLLVISSNQIPPTPEGQQLPRLNISIKPLTEG